MSLIYWLPEFDIKIGIIDQQHKLLVELINELYDELTRTKDRAAISKTLNKLGIYTATHFAREEDFLEKYDYPELDEHIQEHEYFEDMLNQYESEFNSGKQELTANILNFLGDWLIKHINGTDKKYSTFLRTRGVS